MALLKIHDKEIVEIPAMSSKDLLEKQIEDILVESNLKPLYGQELLVIGRQIQTKTKKILDILAIDLDGQLIVVELKRGSAPRETIAQIIDYASWLNKLSERDIEKIFRENNNNKSLSEEFRRFYETDFEKGDDIVLFLFANSFPEEVKNAADYLSEKGVSISCMEYDIFGEPDKEMFLYAKEIAGEESGEAPTTRIKDISPTKRKDRNFFKNLASIMQEKYDEWISQFDDYELKRSFKLHQKLDGSKTRVFCKWRYKGSRLLFQASLYVDTEDEWLGVRISIHNHSIFKQIISQKEISELASKAGMIILDEDDNRGIRFPSIENYRNSDGTIKDEIIDVLCEQFERAKPVMEAIITQ